MRYAVYEGHMNDLRKKVTTIQKKCLKFGCDFTFEEIGEEIRAVKDLEGNVVNVKFIIVEAEGTAIINGWEFVASVEHTSKGNIFSKAMTDVEIPERYRNSDPICEHCNSNRMRKDTFIIRNTETGEFKMVGKSCLKDFTFGMSASTASFMASLKAVFTEYEERPIGGCSWSARYAQTEEVLKYTAETIRHFGYTKSDDADSTKSRMELFFDLNHGYKMADELKKETKELMEKVGFNAESPEAEAMVQEALNWLDGQEASNDYMHNLKVACANEWTHFGRYGLLVSLFPTFNRELEKEALRKQEALKGQMSEFVGQVGDRITFKIADIKCITSWESTYGYYPTTTFVWKLTSTDGNIFTWKTTTCLNEEDIGKTVKGTVKEHKTFREVKQTEVTRCKIA